MNDKLIQEIFLAPMKRPYIDSVGLKAIAQYQRDPVAVTRKYERSCQRQRVIAPVLWTTGLGGFVTVLLTLFVCGILGNDNPSLIEPLGILLCIGGGLLVLSIFAGFYSIFQPAYISGTKTLQEHHRYYLPSIQYSTTAAGIRISLEDLNREYITKTFSPDEEQEALEYQVELEAIIEEVKSERLNRFIQQYVNSVPSPPKQLSAAPVYEQLAFEDHIMQPPVEKNSAVTELRKTLHAQREVIKV